MIRSLMILLFLLTPTPITNLVSGFIKIALSNKYSSSGVGLLLVSFHLFIVLHKKKWKKTSLDFFILSYIFLNIFYFIYAVFVYDIKGEELVGQQKLLILSVLTFLLFFAVYYFLGYNGKLYSKLIKTFTAGALFFTAIPNIIVIVYLAFVQGTSDLYTIKTTLKLIAIDVQNLEPWEMIQKYPSYGSLIVYVARFSEGLTNTVMLANLLSFCAVLSLGMHLFSSRKINLWFLSFCLMAVSSLLLTQRTAMMGLIVGVLFVYLIIQALKTRDVTVAIFRTLVLSIFVTILAGFFILSQDSLMNKLTVEGFKQESRWVLWRNAIYLISINPFGYGYLSVHNESIFGDGKFADGVSFEHSGIHNVFLSNGMDLGFFGMLVYIAIVLIPLLVSIRNLSMVFKINLSFQVIKDDIALKMAVLALPLYLIGMIGMFFTDHIFVYVSAYTTTIILFIAVSFKVNKMLKGIYVTRENSSKYMLS